jgi:NADH-quinone oxidoreductase subunit I
MVMYGLGIAKGMLVTLRHFWGTYRFAKDPFRGKAIVTTEYPDERLPLPERFRGRPEWLRNKETGLPACTACGVCIRACPHGCIVLESHMGPDKKRVVDKYTIDLGRCIMCGLCADACAFHSLAMSHEFELACYSRKSMDWDGDMLLEPATKA